jgi:chromosome segregation protein
LKFTRLRLSGFKSFVEPTELFIEPGLTAIVGPNGCGKSNLFDALRWVMGETRPTSVRGSEMDDVIFAGSAGRPARNVAEVTLFVDNSDRSASPAYNDQETIEVSRRIEREAGSVYRINGRDVRQRDVQIFFADASSGAASTAFVRQGQIGMLVSQKPLARRAILEEAAGISGLHQRRHEAELRLRAAETNLGRLEDIVREVESQLQSLKRQARQASRYRNLSGHIRKAEALAHFLRWTAAELRSNAAQEALTAAAATVSACAERAAHASTAQAEAASLLPPLRETEAEKSAALHRLVMQREALDAEEARARETAEGLKLRMIQTDQDAEREEAQKRDASSALAQLAEELGSLDAAALRAEIDFSEAEAQTAKLNAALVDCELVLERLTAELAELNAARSSHERAREVSQALAETTERQLDEAKARLGQALEGALETPDVQLAQSAAEQARAVAQNAREALNAARHALDEARESEERARQPLEQAEREAQALSAEARALSDLLRPEGQDLWPPLVDAVTVQPGYEAALAAALGDDMQAPLDEAAPHHWRDLGDFDARSPLPDGAKPLANFVKAPSALDRRLAMTGVVFPDQGAKLQGALKPGQRLVSPRGDLWRWDGYAASADAPSPAAARLTQRNRLAEIEAALAQAKAKRAEAFAVYSRARDETEAARSRALQAEEEDRKTEKGLIEAQDDAARTARAAADRAARLATLEAEIRRLTAALEAARDAERQASEMLAELGDGASLSQAVTVARQTAADARAASSEARANLETLRREREGRERRRSAIAEDETRWRARREGAEAQIEELGRRREQLNAALAAALAVPESVAEKRGALMDAIGAAESARARAADARAAAESALAEADKHAKAAEAALSAAREERARAEAVVEAETARMNELRERIRDELDCAPSELAERAEIKDDQELPPLELAEKRVEKLKQEREQLGGVNLRAEEEAAEQEARLATLTGDRDDLIGAIDRLRRGIQSLNREGRERLLDSFDKVNRNFQTLFSRLFEGGEARLSLTESEDPLEAGLEIYARPPGKRLQSLALLSGGEQALTALALIFAVFLVNPAPVCVLDEVDAPLDDANVERFCNLLDEMTKLAQTRFLVITHHALTMSRMHRLFGVTMAERGVSQLVSVTLAEAERVAAE